MIKEKRVLVYDKESQWIGKEFNNILDSALDFKTSVHVPVMVKTPPCLVLNDTSFIFGEDDIVKYLERI